MNRLKQCPPEYQERLTRAGGLNRYGSPNFILVWGGSYRVRRGGTWNSGDYYYQGYRDELEDGRPIWVLKQWFPPEVYGSPALWFDENRERESGLQLLGDFPWRGQYETVQPLISKEVVNGVLKIETMPLNGLIIDVLIPMIMAWKTVGDYRKRIAFEAWHDRKEKELDQKFEDSRHDAQMAFRGPVSYARQGCRTSLVDLRMRAIEQHWDRAVRILKRQGLGVTIH